LDEILPFRKRIDEIDEEILRLLKERVNVSKIIGDVKREHGLPIRDHRREEEVYKHITGRASELGMNPLEIEGIYRKIVAVCAHAQEK